MMKKLLYMTVIFSAISINARGGGREKAYYSSEVE